MDELTENTAFFLVLEFLQAFKNSNGVSMDKLDSYTGENYQTYVNMLKIPIKKFVRNCEGSGILEKVTGANKKMTYKINDVEKLQKRMREVILDKQKINSMKNQRRWRGRRVIEKKPEKKEEKINQASKIENKAISSENVIKISTTNQSRSTAVAESKLVVGASISHGIISNLVTDQKTTGSTIEKTSELHSIFSQTVMETLTDLMKRNGSSMDEMSSYIDKYYEVGMEILKSFEKRLQTCTLNEGEKISYSQKATRKTVLKAVAIRPLIPKIVLEFLQASKNSNGVSVKQINTYIGENYQVFVEVLKTQIETILRKCEKNGIIEKVIGVNKQILYKKKDTKEVQKRIQDLLLEEQKLTSVKNKRPRRKGRRSRKTLIEMEMSEENEDRKKGDSKGEGKTNTHVSKINHLGSFDRAEKDIDDGLLVAHGIVNNFVTGRNTTQNAIKNTPVLRPLVSKIVAESLNIVNAASNYEVSSYNCENYDVAEEFKIKDDERAEKFIQCLNTMKEKAEYLKNAPAQKGHWRNRRGSGESIRKNNDNAEECSSKEKNSRKTKADNSKIKKSDGAYMSKKEVFSATLNVTEASRYFIAHSGAPTKIVKKVAEISSLAQEIALEPMTALEKYNSVIFDQISASIDKNYHVDMKMLNSSIQNFSNRGLKNYVFEKINGTDAEEMPKIKEAEKDEKCKQGLKRKADSEKNVLVVRKKRIN